MVSEFNLFEAMGMVRQRSATPFFGTLFNPRENPMVWALACLSRFARLLYDCRIDVVAKSLCSISISAITTTPRYFASKIVSITAGEPVGSISEA